jgi:hypothetical protein
MQKFFGATLIGCGILVAGLSGLCVVLLVGSAITSGGGVSGVDVVPVMLFLLLPVAAGIGIAYGGRKLIQNADEADLIPPRPIQPPPPDLSGIDRE